jgi:DNA-binding NarL/FixJ family response regulator
MGKIRIMLVDDHVLVRMGIVTATRFQPDMEVVAEVEDGEVALETFRQVQPDVVILDLRMPKVDGLDVIGMIRKESRTAKVLILSSYASGADVSRAIQAGADGYVRKGMPLEQLLAAIRAVHAGERFVPPEIATRLASMMQSRLSDRELDVLRLVAKGRRNKEIAVELQISEPTVKTHVANILTKLRAADRTEAVTVALKLRLLQLE